MEDGKTEDGIVEDIINSMDDYDLVLATYHADAVAKAIEPFLALGEHVIPLHLYVTGGGMQGEDMHLTLGDGARVEVMDAVYDTRDTSDDNPVFMLHKEQGLSVNLDLDRVLDALKWFGSELVAIIVKGQWLSVVNMHGTRRVRLMAPEGEAVKVPRLDPEDAVAIFPDADMLRRIGTLGGIGETITLRYAQGVFEAIAESDTERAVVRQSTGLAHNVESMFPSDRMCALVKHIKVKDDEGPAMVVANKYPIEVKWRNGPISYQAIIAPRVPTE